MKTRNILEKSTKAYVAFSIFALLYVSILAMISPQQVMDMVQVNLTNTDAISSIRGVYGGVGLSISISLVYLYFKNYSWALNFLVVFWGNYALCRALTIFLDGGLGDFGTNWLIIESTLFAIGGALAYGHIRTQQKSKLLYPIHA